MGRRIVNYIGRLRAQVPVLFSGTGLVFFAMLLMAVTVIWAGGYLFAQAEIRRDFEGYRARDMAAARGGASALRMQLREMAADIQYLTHLPYQRKAFCSPAPGDRERIEDNFAAYISAHGRFSQIRSLDMSGMETARVNFVNGWARIAPTEDLQDKSRRPYVSAIAALPPGGIYVSPFDLNVESGKIETPFNPTIRLGAPVALDGRCGMVVVNYIGRRILELFLHAAGSESSRAMLLNGDGYWLYSPTAQEEWGFMFGNHSTFGHSHAEAWVAMQKEPQGQVLLEDGLWTWESIFPLREVRDGYPPTPGVEPTVAGARNYQWRVVLRLPSSAVAGIGKRVWGPLTLVLVALSLFSVLACGWVFWSRIKVERLNLELVERARAAEEASRAKAAFLANMSHEIRTPMNAVLGIAYLLEQTEMPQAARELVRKVRHAGRSLMAIINDILDFSKIEAGHLEIERAPFRLADVFDDLAAVMSSTATAKDIESVIVPPPAGIDWLRGDALRLGQVLVNLAGNAIKFTERGYVMVSVELAAVDNRDAILRFSVRDTGIGICPHKQKEIFQPFSQADVSTTRNYGGTGLGLTICQRLVALMGGEMGVSSEPGRGSEFWFTLPFELLDAVNISAPEMVELDVLIVDGNSISQRALRNTVSSLGWKPKSVPSGEAALRRVVARLAERGSHEVVILDWKLPDMDGMATARALRKALKGQQWPIILVISAYWREKILAEGKESEVDSWAADAVLSKPVTASALYDAVVKALHGAEASRPAVPNLSAGKHQRLFGIRILVVDDSEINREVAQRILVGEGAEVDLAGDGQEALDCLRNHPSDYDIVLMDVQMPAMDGYQATRLIRSMPELADLPVVALTAGAFKSQHDAAREAGMTDFIAKPFNVDATVALILRLVDHGGHTVALHPSDLPFEPVGAAVPASAVNAETGHFPGIDVAVGLAFWKEAAVYGKFLRHFARDYAEAGRALEKGEVAVSAALAHKLKGAAASLSLPEVAARAGDVERLLYDGGDAADALLRLQHALAEALESIRHYAPDSEELAPTAGLENSVTVAALAIHHEEKNSSQ